MPELLICPLARGEQEWLQNAPDTYGDDAGEVWVQDIFPRFLTGNLQDVDIEDLQLYTPKMLNELSSEQLRATSEPPIEKILNALEGKQ